MGCWCCSSIFRFSSDGHRRKTMTDFGTKMGWWHCSSFERHSDLQRFLFTCKNMSDKALFALNYYMSCVSPEEEGNMLRFPLHHILITPYLMFACAVNVSQCQCFKVVNVKRLVCLGLDQNYFFVFKKSILHYSVLR